MGVLGLSRWFAIGCPVLLAPGGADVFLMLSWSGTLEGSLVVRAVAHSAVM